MQTGKRRCKLKERGFSAPAVMPGSITEVGGTTEPWVTSYQSSRHRAGTVGTFSTFQFIQILNVVIWNESEAGKFIWLASVFIRVLNWNQSLRAIGSIWSRKSRLNPVQFIMKGNNSVVLTGAELKVCWCVGWGGALCQKPNLQHSSFNVMKSVRAHHHSEL